MSKKDRRCVRYERIHRTSELYTSRMLVECECGHQQRHYIWSWAGHGFARCKSCQGCHDYWERYPEEVEL